MIDRTSPVPLYHQLSELILSQIKEGQLRPGEAIPTEQELIRLYSISRMTVRNAINELERKGYVRREQGRGTFVAPPRIQRGMARLTSFSEELAARGLRPGSRLLRLRQQPATSNEARVLGIEEGEAVWFVERLRLADAEPIALSISHVRLPPGLALAASEFENEGSLWALLAKKGITFAESDKTIGAILADDRQADLLGASKDVPLLLVESVVYTSDGAPVELSQVIGRADRYKYHLHVTK